ncbi:Uncharacterised protein [Raoultella terrigena]|uniref:Uncharacterized protein n=1 Tax=Raoultella terrigena TaxID=577 RepID=A0A4U9DAC2_RAOTE|nr:Uncharacterised protein [Raoultella terrigena]
MVSALNRLAAMEHQDRIRFDYRRQAVGQSQSASCSDEPLPAPAGSPARCRNRYWPLPRRGSVSAAYRPAPWPRQQLLLAHREIVALLAQLGYKARPPGRAPARPTARLQRVPDLRLADIAAESDVGVEGIGQQTGSCCTMATPWRNALWLKEKSGRPSIRISPLLSGSSPSSGWQAYFCRCRCGPPAPQSCGTESPD